MNRQCLRDRRSVDEMEAENLVQNERLGPEPVPFGFMHQHWLDLLERMEEGDELWTFRSSSASWKNLCGRAGVALVRKRKVIHHLVTMMN